MGKWIDAEHRLGSNAYARDHFGNEYTGEALMLLLLLHTKKGKRTKENEEAVAAFMNDPNLDPPDYKPTNRK